MNHRYGPLFLLALVCICFSCKTSQTVVDQTRNLGVPSLRMDLAHQIDEHTFYSYRELWELFPQTDIIEGDKIIDIYAHNGEEGLTDQPYTYTVLADQCGNYRKEGDCYNREHSFPKSWWGRSKDTMYSDLFHIYPTDGYVNNIRGNYPFGETDTPVRESLNGSKLGPSSFPGYTGTVFEPIDAYKGDLARTYFYMLTRYYHRIPSWESPMLQNGDFSPWARRLLLKWHAEDPVSQKGQKEIDRDKAIQALQGNFNPFVRNPELAEEIWSEENF